MNELLLRMSPKLRLSLDNIAKEKNISLTRLINEILAEYTETPIDVSTDIIGDLQIRVEALEKEIFGKSKK